LFAGWPEEIEYTKPWLGYVPTLEVHRCGAGACRQQSLPCGFCVWCKNKTQNRIRRPTKLDYHGNHNWRAATATAVILATGDAIDALEADLETKLGLSGSNDRNHRNPRLVSALLGSHEGFDVVASKQTADQSTKTMDNTISRGSGARHE
jgi:hypothetical protein